MKKNDNGLHFSNSYLNLNQKMFSKISPNTFGKSELIQLNEPLAEELGINTDFLKSNEGVALLSGNSDSNGPLFSQAYAGHQYGHFTMLGDGRAVMLGEQITPSNSRFDIQVKGSGRTPYSRGGDGLASLSSMLREYLISEAMFALGVPTTRSLAVVRTNDKIRRNTFEDGAVLIRVASSHIRIGTFEYAKVYGNTKILKELADYTIDRHYSHLNHSGDKYQEFLREVIKKQASLIAKWQSFGFIHGVMNTDNVLVSGETIDYGPCAFMNQYDPKTVFSSIDKNGRYAYLNQPYIASWNLTRFAEAILELLDESQERAIKKANDELVLFEQYYNKYWLINMASKFGIKNPTEEDQVVIDEFLSIMETYNADFTNTFALLTQGRFENIVFYNTEEWLAWFKKWTRALGYRKTDVNERIQIMRESNPKVIARNHLVEEALYQAATVGEYTLFNELHSKLMKPFDYTVEHNEKFTQSIEDDNYKTYCGT